MVTNCANCQHFCKTEWAELNAEQLDRFGCGRRPRSFLPGEPIYHQGDAPSGVYCVSSGLIGIRKVDAEGDSVLLRLVRPGETFGFRSFLTDEPHQVSAEALKESSLCLIPSSAATQMTRECPNTTLAFFRHLARDMAETETKVLETITASGRVRFLRLLVAFGAVEADTCQDERSAQAFELPLSRQDIAAMIGVRPESMSRMIRAVQEEGLARFAGRRVEVLDPLRLETESLGEAEF